MCPTSSPTADFSLTFPPEPHWVHSARAAVRTALTPVVPDDSEFIDIAALLTSELVTNAVLASLGSLSPAPVAVHGEWSRTGEGMRVLVHDRAPGGPLVAERLPSPEAEHGRGLLLISLYASDWGVCRHVPGPGKAVWFSLGPAGKP